MLVGGLGLGFTVRALLADDRVRRVVVAELHPEVVAAIALVDSRLEVVIGDVRDLRHCPARWLDGRGAA